MSKVTLQERLKSLRLHGMVAAWEDLVAEGESTIASSKWLLDHLVEAEETDRAMRSVRLNSRRQSYPYTGICQASTSVLPKLMRIW